MMRNIQSAGFVMTLLVLTAMAVQASPGQSAAFASKGARSQAWTANLPSTPSDDASSAGTAGSITACEVGPNGRLARVTAYWASEGDYYTRHCISATGVRLHDGHCAVDPNIIPYGSVVRIAGLGTFLAVDTGTAVVCRTAAREAGHTRAERSAIVIDVFFENRREGEAFASSTARWASISWWTPNSNTVQAKQARNLFAEEDCTKAQAKQL